MILDAALGLVRDAWRLHAGASEEELALGPQARALAARSLPRDLARRGAFLAEARADVERNLAPAHLVERALLVLADGVLPSAARTGRPHPSAPAKGFVEGRATR